MLSDYWLCFSLLLYFYTHYAFCAFLIWFVFNMLSELFYSCFHTFIFILSYSSVSWFFFIILLFYCFIILLSQFCLYEFVWLSAGSFLQNAEFEFLFLYIYVCMSESMCILFICCFILCKSLYLTCTGPGIQRNYNHVNAAYLQTQISYWHEKLEVETQKDFKEDGAFHTGIILGRISKIYFYAAEHYCVYSSARPSGLN